MKPVLGILLGDSCGVGPEIVAKLCKEEKLNKYCKPLIIGDKRIFEWAKGVVKASFEVKTIETAEEIHKLDIKENVYYILDQKNVNPDEITVGEVSKIAGKASGDMLMLAIDLCKKKILDGFSFAPLNKAAMKEGGYKLESENKLFGEEFDRVGLTCEVNVLDGLWTSRVTSHVPVKDIVQYLTVDSIYNGIKLAYDTLKFSGNENPTIGVAALNPHGGENGTCGREEIEVIEPAIEKARANGIIVKGPYPADILFIKAFNGDFNAAVTMYHDQGQIALKLKGFQYGVTVHANLPVAIATAAHGSAFDIAGKNIATTDAMENAVKMTASIAMGLKK
ncbi:MAG: 4-hydroxythreonine-4-phosphate dehydrogenase [Candidatus Epulonipiscium fishelsonii]|nr:MAG: 4-hydroxythreonine-4-phosphate dehydrogenase [Epulopiscium sp. AS2M-Bin002]